MPTKYSWKNKERVQKETAENTSKYASVSRIIYFFLQCLIKKFLIFFFQLS